MDQVSPPELNAALDGWLLPAQAPFPGVTEYGRGAPTPALWDFLALARQQLQAAEGVGAKAETERALLRWLCALVRQNVKRGRIIQLDRVLKENHADCLGYARLLAVLGRTCGLDIGIVEVIIDNSGRYVPHVAGIVKLSDGTTRFVDLWYGSSDIGHRRLGLQVRKGDAWVIADVNYDDLHRMADVAGLPTRSIEAITQYIIGNRHLAQGLRHADGEEVDEAIRCYDAAIRLYPHNARPYFNRAVAYENLGESERAARDYARALKDEAGQIRVLAREYEEPAQLIDLDEAGIEDSDQQVFLLRKGFITGTELAMAEVARRCGVSLHQAERIMSRIEGLLH